MRRMQPYGGVVPEIAARSHIEHMDSVIRTVRGAAGRTAAWSDIDAVAATTGPGLIGGVIVGTHDGQGASPQCLKNLSLP